MAKRRATIDGCCAADDDACLSQHAKDELECSSVAGACDAYDGAPVGKYFCVDDPVESDAATGSVPRALLVLLLPGLLALGLL